MERPRPAAVLVWVVAILSTCGPRDLPGPDVVVRIGQEQIRYSRFEEYIQRYVGEPDAVLGSDVLSELFDQFLTEELLRRLAEERGLAAPETGGRRAVEALLREALAEGPTEAEVRAYYEAHPQEFQRPERVRLRQILVEDRSLAERALQELAARADFADVARRYSRDPSAPFGGYQGELAREDLPPALVETIFRLQPGEITDIVAAEYGFHIFQVMERLPEEVISLEEAAPEIRKKLRREEADRAMEALVTEARKRYTLEVYVRNLPFNYQGLFGSSRSLEDS